MLLLSNGPWFDLYYWFSNFSSYPKKSWSLFKNNLVIIWISFNDWPKYFWLLQDCDDLKLFRLLEGLEQSNDTTYIDLNLTWHRVTFASKLTCCIMTGTQMLWQPWCNSSIIYWTMCKISYLVLWFCSLTFELCSFFPSELCFFIINSFPSLLWFSFHFF
jgi:hypothetical protein